MFCYADLLPFSYSYYILDYNININLETDLPPIKFSNLIEDINHSNLKVNYDTGNSSSLGYHPKTELDLYGDHISVIHIKDRNYNGGTVKLGMGDTNFDAFFNKLKNMEIKGPIIMQASRTENYDKEKDLVIEQFNYLKGKLRMIEKWN